MTSVSETNGDGLNWSRTRRVVVEHDIRPVNSNKNYVNGQSNNDLVIKTMTKQHQDEQEELKELNSKLANYLEHVHDLETFNGQLLAELDEVRDKWGANTEKVNRKYAPDLEKLRQNLDDGLRSKILHELQIQQYEYDADHIQQRTNTFEGDNAIRLNAAEQELAHTVYELEILKKQFDRREAELAQQRLNLQNLDNLFQGLQNELLNHRLERMLVQNEMQTLREEILFEKANHQAQRQEILSLSKYLFFLDNHHRSLLFSSDVPTIDLTKFYRAELTRAISDIRDDFETLFESQLHELEEYYRIKTEEIHEELAQEKERKRLFNEENEENTVSSMLSSWNEVNEEHKQMKMDNTQVEIDLNDTIEDLNRIREEQAREHDKHDLQFNKLQEEYQDKQDIVNGILQNNISLRFELLTYRNLLKSEENRIQRNEQEQPSPPPPPPSTENIQGYSVQKLAVKKESKGFVFANHFRANVSLFFRLFRSYCIRYD